MDGVRERGVLLAHLDEPVGPGTLVRDLDDGIGVGVAGVALEHILHGRLIPVDHHGGGVQVPQSEVLAIGGETGGNSSAEGLNLSGVLALVNGLGPVRNSDELGATICRLGLVAIGGFSGGDSRVCEQSTTVAVVTTVTISGCLGTEEVVARSLVGGEDDIVSLTNGKQEPTLSSQRLSGNEIGGNDGEVVAIKLDTNGIVHRGVDQSQAMLLALGKSHLGVGSSTCSVLSEAVNKDVVTVWWWCVVLEVGKSDVVDIGCKTVVPITDWERTEINIVIGCCGTIDNNCAGNTHTVLG